MALPSWVPSYSWMRVKVGLVTSSGSAASRACAMPFTSVVLPVPSSPRSNRSCGGLSRAASLRPTSTVSAPLRVVNSCTWRSATGASLLILLPRGSPSRCALRTLHEPKPVRGNSDRARRQPLQPNITVLGPRTKAKSLRKMRKGIGGQQRVLVAFADSQVCGEAVEKDRGFDGLFRVVLVLRQQPGDHAGEQVAAASLGHARIA